MDTQYLVYIGIFIAIIIVLKIILNRPSKLKKENEERLAEIKKKYGGKYNDVRTLEKDKKKYS